MSIVHIVCIVCPRVLSFFPILILLNSNSTNSPYPLHYKSTLNQLPAEMKIRSYFGLYASIDISKLARFNDITDTELICLLTSLKHKSISKSGAQTGSGFVHYYIEGE